MNFKTMSTLIASMLVSTMVHTAGEDQSKSSTAPMSQTPSSKIPNKREFTLNENINPCEDFYGYVCSNAIESFQLREDRSSHTFAFDDSSERLLEAKKDFFKKIQNAKLKYPRSAQMREYYKACMNESAAASEERQMVRSLVKEVEAIKTVEDFIKLNVGNLTKSKWSILGFQIGANIDNPLVYDIYFDLDVMFLPEHSYYDNEELVQNYANLIFEFFKELKVKGTDEELKARALAITKYEKEFVKTYPMPAEFRQRSVQPRKISREDFLKLLMPFDVANFFNEFIPKEMQIRDFIPESWKFMSENLRPEQLQVLKDMYLYRNARTHMDDAYPKLYEKRQAFSHKFLGAPPTRPDRHERCTSGVTGAFNRELDQELMAQLFPNFPEAKMQEVADKIRRSIVEGIEKNTWLSPEGKLGALEKIKSAKLQLIQPRTEKEWDFKPIAKYSPSKPYANAEKLFQIGMKRTFEKMRTGVNQDAWGMGPLTVNAYYSPDKNKFVLPIGILQFPFFVPEGDVVENLGAVGAVVGHELGHAIDDQGSKYDSGGRLKQWMTEKDLKNFSARSGRLVEQFAKSGHNGQLTLGENVADNVGLSFAYHAAFKNAENESPEVFKQNQKKFFVAWGRVWCNVMRDKTRERQLKTGPHSLGIARVNEQVKHQAGFQSAYSCKKGNKLFLDPRDQLQIW